MLGIIGGIGLGLVWGWLAVRMARGARRLKAARVPLWVALQALVVARIGAPGALAGFAAGVIVGAALLWVWLHALEARYG